MFKFQIRSMENAFEKSILENKEKHYKLAYYYVKNHHDAMDIMQESILKCYSNLSKIKDEKSINKYLSKIIINTSIDFIRKHSKVKIVDDSYLNNSMCDENNLDMNTTIDALSIDLKNIIILKYFYGYKINEVAEILDISIPTVKNRLHKALKLLRIEFKEDVYE